MLWFHFQCDENCSLFADDMTCFLKDKLSYANLLHTLEVFGECSGLRANQEKTEILALGGNTLQEDLSLMPNLCQIIKILRLYFGYDGNQRDELNFRQTLK